MTVSSFVGHHHRVCLGLLWWWLVHPVMGFSGFCHHEPRPSAFSKPLNMTRKAAPPPGAAWHHIDLVVWAQDDGPTATLLAYHGDDNDDDLSLPSSMGKLVGLDDSSKPSSTVDMETNQKPTADPVSQQQLARSRHASSSLQKTTALVPPSPLWWVYHLVNRMALHKFWQIWERIQQHGDHQDNTRWPHSLEARRAKVGSHYL